MLTKTHTKLIQSLKHKKFRNQYKLFVVEGIKSVKEVENSLIKINKIFCTNEYLNSFDDGIDIIIVSESDFKKISNFKTPSGVLALCEITKNSDEIDEEELILALDGVNDPGNLGTIIRLADWFGIKTILCSKNTVDLYNTKVIQSTMGSFTRVNLIYTDLEVTLNSYTNCVFGAFLEGENIYKAKLPKKGVIVLGNEANGISAEIEKLVTDKITIPQFGHGNTESLNVAMASSIILSEFKRSF